MEQRLKFKGFIMPGNPVNRLEPHWPPMPPAPEEAFGFESESSWTDRLESTLGQVTDMMGRSPKATLAAAAGLGLLLGWIIKRR